MLAVFGAAGARKSLHRSAHRKRFSLDESMHCMGEHDIRQTRAREKIRVAGAHAPVDIGKHPPVIARGARADLSGRRCDIATAQRSGEKSRRVRRAARAARRKSRVQNAPRAPSTTRARS
jgi:hypothetical protein